MNLLSAQTDGEFDEALESILEKVIDDIERDAKLFISLCEDGITAILLIALNRVEGLHATQQAHSNGHVDITIETGDFLPSRRRLGEAKIYHGPQYHKEGLEQLIHRYSTGRQQSGFLLEYFKVADIKQLVTKIREYMDINKPCAQNGLSRDHSINWSFVTEHLHSSGELIRVVHLSCNLYQSSS